MSNHEINICSIHPLGKTIRYSLWQGAAVRGPSQHNLWTFLGLILFYSDQVGKSLKGVNGCCFHGEDRTPTVFNKLLQNSLCIVVFAVCKSSKGTYTNEVAVATHYRDSLQQVLALVAIHDDTAFGLQFPCSGIHIEHDDIHSQVHSRFLCRESCTQGVIKENHHERLVLAQMLEFITFVLNLLCFGEGLTEIANILNIDKTFHMLMILLVMSW